MSEKLGIMVCGHGSRNQNAAKEFAVIAEALRARNPTCRWNTAISNSAIR